MKRQLGRFAATEDTHDEIAGFRLFRWRHQLCEVTADKLTSEGDRGVVLPPDRPILVEQSSGQLEIFERLGDVPAKLQQLLLKTAHADCHNTAPHRVEMVQTALFGRIHSAESGGMTTPAHVPVPQHDPLTGFGDHDKLLTDLTEALNRGGVLSVLAVFELLGSRDYRRVFGEQASDELIVRLAERFRQVIQPVGVCYRPRQDEFGALIVGSIESVSSTLFAAEEALSLEEESSVVTACFGAASLPDESTDPIDLLILADQRIHVRMGSREPRERRHRTSRPTKSVTSNTAKRSPVKINGDASENRNPGNSP